MQSVKLALCFAFHLSFFVNILVRNVMQMSMWCFTALRHQRVSVIDIVPLCDKTTEYFLNVQPCSFITSSQHSLLHLKGNKTKKATWCEKVLVVQKSTASYTTSPACTTASTSPPTSTLMIPFFFYRPREQSCAQGTVLLISKQKRSKYYIQDQLSYNSCDNRISFQSVPTCVVFFFKDLLA